MSLPIRVGGNGKLKQFDVGDVLPTSNGGMPAGGTTGQVPVKASNSDHDWTFANLPGAASYITPSLITSDSVDYAPTGFDSASLVRVSCDSSMPAIKGFTYNGRPVRFLNVGDNPLVFVGNYSGTTGSKRIDMGGEFVLLPKDSITFDYDPVATRWYLIDGIAREQTSNLTTIFEKFGSVTLADYSTASFAALSTGSTATVTGVAAYPSGIGLSTAATAITTGGAAWLLKSTNSFWFFGSAHFEATALITLQNLSDATNRFKVGLQLRPSVNGINHAVNNCISLDYTDNDFGGNWRLFSQNNSGSQTTANSNVAVVANKMYLLRIVVNASLGEARFYVNDEMVGKIDVSLPTNVAFGPRVYILKDTAGDSIRRLVLHNIGIKAAYPS